MPQLQTVEQEHNDLGLHVDLCAQRYASLDARLIKIEEKIVKIEEKLEGFEGILTENKRSLSTVIISSSATILAGLLGLIVTVLLKF